VRIFFPPQPNNGLSRDNSIQPKCTEPTGGRLSLFSSSSVRRLLRKSGAAEPINSGPAEEGRGARARPGPETPESRNTSPSRTHLPSPPPLLLFKPPSRPPPSLPRPPPHFTYPSNLPTTLGLGPPPSSPARAPPLRRRGSAP
jgi:hypothetical protein